MKPPQRCTTHINFLPKKTQEFLQNRYAPAATSPPPGVAHKTSSPPMSQVFGAAEKNHNDLSDISDYKNIWQAREKYNKTKPEETRKPKGRKFTKSPKRSPFEPRFQLSHLWALKPRAPFRTGALWSSAKDPRVFQELIEKNHQKSYHVDCFKKNHFPPSLRGFHKK